ncbi:MAG: hypothetical protein TR69_WS6001001169 [candidate division WS6 bacterium OLB20]|uniref:Uncharacterized protein n=1 Tax=candidate division WS6 bacterium OLB20 TaxID=1617426 RepID=A0A136LWZ4_9BACT|nr:MAG: hypothetical protein TR69_WS6001001169 [candidate division WS6 bacterium OLB20]
MTRQPAQPAVFLYHKSVLQSAKKDPHKAGLSKCFWLGLASEAESVV